MTDMELADWFSNRHPSQIGCSEQERQQIIAALRREPEPEVCPRCKGSGEAKGMTYGHGPDDYEIDVPCPACNGTGERPPSGEMVMLKKLLQASESMRHGGYRDALVAAYDGWAHEARAMLSAVEASKGKT